MRSWLYDVNGQDAPVDATDIRPADLNDMQILWLDVDLEQLEDLGQLWTALGVGDELRSFDRRPERPSLVLYDNVMQLNVRAIREEEADVVPVVLHCLLGKNWVATLHEGEFGLVEEFNKPLANESQLGELDAPAFLSVVLDWHLSGYFRRIEQLQVQIDRVDEELLKPEPNRPQLLERLYSLRRQVTKLRLSLSPHRDVLGPLSNPHTEGLSDASDFQRLSKRLDSALVEVNTAREMISVSFDIYMAQVSKDTNDIMKRLTLVSVLLLPAVVLAGIMGMNFKVELFDVPWLFWITLLTMVLMAGFTLFVARRRKWL